MSTSTSPASASVRSKPAPCRSSATRRATRAPATCSPSEQPLALSTLTFSYEPRHDGEPDPGEVVWTWVAYVDDPSQGKDRPVVIVGRFDDGTLAGVALTSKVHPELHAERVPVGTGDWDSEHRPSFAKVEQVLHVRAENVRREGAALARDRWDAVVAAVRSRHV